MAFPQVNVYLCFDEAGKHFYSFGNVYLCFDEAGKHFYSFGQRHV